MIQSPLTEALLTVTLGGIFGGGDPTVMGLPVMFVVAPSLSFAVATGT